jgi:predicted GH43/DUF377 family glycosyl hydrolase
LALMLLGWGWGPAGVLPDGDSHFTSAGELRSCDQLGWFPQTFGLKDHTVFSYDGSYYIAATYLGADAYEDQFAYAVSTDLCHWDDLGGILHDRPAGAWDEHRIWAPHVLQVGGVYFMYYTGVTSAYAQSIMLATTTNPANPNSWQRQGVMFQPTHPGSLWEGFEAWSDCRDPTVIEENSRYFLYYTGLDTGGGIVGLATAPSPQGPWSDWGAVVTTPDTRPESSTVTSYQKLSYLFYHEVGPSGAVEVYSYGPTLAGPWQGSHPFHYGWAHEIWVGPEGALYTSYLTDYTITIRRLTWDEVYDPPRPYVGDGMHRMLIPIVIN